MCSKRKKKFFERRLLDKTEDKLHTFTGTMKKSLILFLIFTATYIHNAVNANNAEFDPNIIRAVYLDKLMKTISNETTIPEYKLQEYFTKHSIHKAEQSNITRCINETDGVNLDENCLLESCLSPSDVLELSGLVNSKTVTSSELSTLAAILVHLYENSSCVTHTDHAKSDHKAPHTQPSSAEAWGYGILCVTAINVCSLGGLVVLPFIHHSLYKKILIFMIALAVGTLSGSSLLFLIPEALELADDDINAESIVWKSMTIILGIYVFFNIERILKMIMEFRKAQYGKFSRQKSEDPAADISTFHEAPPAPNADYKDVDKLPKYASPCGDNNVRRSNSSSSISEISTELQDSEAELKKQIQTQNGISNGHTKRTRHSSHHEDKPVAPVAWMIIFGDGLHNFIDGVSIGAAFTDSILAGLSVSLAIFCEELPHELGDFAVLLNAGMRLKRAVMYNFLSACMCYIGMIIGIVLGENTAAHTWVFAFAGGMFLYISLVDMMPEMNSCAESEDNKKQIGEKFIYLLQNLGLLTGFGIMLLMAVYGGNISFE